jgi:hypothetical protein
MLVDTRRWSRNRGLPETRWCGRWRGGRGGRRGHRGGGLGHAGWRDRRRRRRGNGLTCWRLVRGVRLRRWHGGRLGERLRLRLWLRLWLRCPWRFGVGLRHGRRRGRGSSLRGWRLLRREKDVLRPLLTVPATEAGGIGGILVPTRRDYRGTVCDAHAGTPICNLPQAQFEPSPWLFECMSEPSWCAVDSVPWRDPAGSPTVCTYAHCTTVK